MKITCAVVCLTLMCFTTVSANHVWINEFHYDNDGGDVGEFVEVVIRDTPLGQDLAGVGVYLYNGSNGQVYDSITLDDPTIVTTPGAGFSFHVWNVAGIQNGAPDALALTVDGVTNEFFSYEGQLTATDGPAIGLTSLDIGVAETGSTPIGSALGLTGAGEAAFDFVWSGPQQATPGLANLNQTLIPEPASGLLLVLGIMGVFITCRHSR